MNKSRILFRSVLLIFVLTCIGQTKIIKGEFGPRKPQKSTALDPANTLSNISNWSYWLSYDGGSANEPGTGNAGGIYPRSAIAAIFQDGLVWGAVVNGNIKVGGQTYRVGTQPQLGHIYRIRKNWAELTTTNVRNETAEFYNISVESVTDEQANEIINQYKKDWKEWPVDQGAPFVDVDGNGIYNPVLDGNGMPDASLGDYPGINNADQVVWLKVDDQDAQKTLNLYGSEPIGLELQVTVWAFDQPESRLGQSIFKKYKIKNISGNYLNEMYLAQWADVDLGNYSDDLSGCDQALNAGFVYNGRNSDSEYDKFGLIPPAAGYAVLQGPVVPSTGDTAYFDSGYLPDYRNLPMTSFSYFSSGSGINDPMLGNYDGTLQWYNMLRGNKPSTNIDNPEKYTHQNGPNINQVTKFPLDGDPFLGVGDIDGGGNNMPPGDRRIVITSGPFVLAPGESQEMVVAVVGGLGNSYLNSVNELKTNIKTITDSYGTMINGDSVLEPKLTYQSNHPDPNSTELFFKADLSEFDDVTSCSLTLKPLYGSAPPLNVVLYNDGQHGDQLAEDNIWANTVTESNKKYPYTADLELNRISGDIRYSDFLTFVRLRPVPTLENWHVIWENRKLDSQINNNETVHLQFDIHNNDAVNAIDFLSVTQDEEVVVDNGISAGAEVAFDSDFFVVTAPSNADSVIVEYSINYDKYLDRVQIKLPVVLFEEEYGTIQAIHNRDADGTVTIKVLEPDSLTGDDYLVYFEQNASKTDLDKDAGSADETKTYWYLKNVTKDMVVLDNQTIIDGVDVYTGELKGDPIVDGFMITVKCNFDIPKTFSSVTLIKTNGTKSSIDDRYSQNKNIGDYYHYGWAEDATSFTTRGFGSGDTGELGNDYECRWTGAYKSTPVVINGVTTWEVESGGSMASLYGARNDNLANHPLNPNFGTEAPFLVRIPFEVWNINTGEQINLSIYDRKQKYDGSMDIYAFNPSDRMYTDFVNTPYDSVNVIPGDGGTSAEHFTWNLVWWGNIAFEKGDTMQVAYDGVVTASDTFMFSGTEPTAIRNGNPLSDFKLYQNYPNPFNPITTIPYQLKRLGKVELNVYNVLGQKVCTLINKKQTSGSYNLRFDASNLASGVYIYRLKTENFVSCKKMLFLK